jgi:hypothetical protein
LVRFTSESRLGSGHAPTSPSGPTPAITLATYRLFSYVAQHRAEPEEDQPALVKGGEFRAGDADRTPADQRGRAERAPGLRRSAAKRPVDEEQERREAEED